MIYLELRTMDESEGDAKTFLFTFYSIITNFLFQNLQRKY